MAYDIDGFWTQRLHGLVRPSSPPSMTGWSIQAAPNTSFVEAELTLRDGYDDLETPIWFVAAPGAVGKSTLAKAISARTGAVYLDLAKAETVAGNYLTGGLVKNRLFDAWQANKSTLLIDALDEARLRVTQNSFEDFLKDVETLVRGRTLPAVFFGRVGIVDEAWLILADAGLSCPIFDIDFFDRGRSLRFIMAVLDRLSGEQKYRGLATSLKGHRAAYETATANFVTGLESASASDGTRFSGYAPVLEAVATALAEVTNPARLNDEVQRAMQGEILIELTEQILTREAGKIRAQLPDAFSDSAKNELYKRDEQLARLAALIYGTPTPLPATALPPQLIGPYETAVSGFLPNHPFLDGTGHQASGAVFAAAINANALFSKTEALLSAAEKHAGDGPHTPNPFLIDFYLDEATGEDTTRIRVSAPEGPMVPPEHVVALYESVRARGAARDIVRLTVEGDEGDEADVEILIISGDGPTPIRIPLRTSQAGVLRFGRQVNGVSVDAPHLDVIIGSGNPVELIAPVTINAARVAFDCPELVIGRGDYASAAEDSAVTIEAGELLRSSVTSVPVVRRGADFSVWWPGAVTFPWSHFAGQAGGANGADVSDGLRALRRLVLAFRSHSKGRLARFKDKIEHARMTKGPIGIAVREKLLSDKILSVEGEMYFLNPTALGQVVGATYQDLKLKRFSERVRAYVASIRA